MCEENCALFVPLYRLSPVEAQQKCQQQPTDEQKHKTTTRSQNQAKHNDPGQHGHLPNQSHLRFKLNERVVVYNRQGIGVHGSVRWVGELVFAGEKLHAVGIETVIHVFFNHPV